MFNIANPSIKVAICSAIKARRVIEFYYHGGFRTAEPFCLGVTKPGADGNESLLCYQVGGHSEYGNTSGWKLFRASEMSDLEITRERFSGDRPGYNPDNPEMTTIYCCIPESAGGKVRTEEAKVIREETRVRTKDTVAPVLDIEKKIPGYEMPRKPANVYLTHNELMRKFRFTHPAHLPELYTNIFVLPNRQTYYQNA